MPEQPPDPRHYDMRIPPPHDPNTKPDSQKPASDRSDGSANTGRENSVDDDKHSAGHSPK
ncbi:hypothetical protein P8935_11030 [Telmatobacter sp. DSM 110680]|uniref:Uncharacterized protein n=1 Tax=Telmatobacter sp. DSM 110680 TaxID=3036704 RepID=A0AAU7DQX6_9BACT